VHVSTKTICGDCLKTTTPPIYKCNGSISLPGKYNQQKYDLKLDSDFLSKHLLLVGETGCGKTNVINYLVHQIKQNITENDVLIIFDTKGDYLKKFYSQGDYVVSNSENNSIVSKKWNIFKEILIDGYDDNKIYNNANEIISSLFKETIEKSNQPFFPNAAKDILVSIIIAIIRLGKDDENFKLKYFNNKALKQYLDQITAEKISSLLSKNIFSDLSSVLSYIGDGTSDQSLGVMAEMQSVVRKIFVDSFADDGRFSVRNLVREKGGKTLFIEYDLSLGETLLPIYRIIFDLALKEALGRNKLEGNVYLICDEFKLLPNLHHIEDGVNFGRSLGVKIIAGIQSVEQLYDVYGEYKGKSIVSGFSSLFAFRTGDSTTREFISNKYGKNIVLEQYISSNNILVEEKREGKTVEDWDINSLKVGQAIIGLPYEKPFVFQFDYFKG